MTAPAFDIKKALALAALCRAPERADQVFNDSKENTTYPSYTLLALALENGHDIGIKFLTSYTAMEQSLLKKLDDQLDDNHPVVGKQQIHSPDMSHMILNHESRGFSYIVENMEAVCFLSALNATRQLQPTETISP